MVRQLAYIKWMSIGFAMSLASNFLCAQSIERSSMASVGFDGYIGPVHVECNVGQWIVNTAYLNDGVITQGFLQPNIAGYTDVSMTSSTIEIKVYPNPFTDGVWIDCPKCVDGGMVELFTPNGRLIKRVTVDNVLQYLNLSEAPAGVYFLRVIQRMGKIKSQLIIKQNIYSPQISRS